MTQSSEAILSLPIQLRNMLLELMPSATFREEALCEGCLPLVLMLRDHAVTAFAVGGEGNYEQLYTSFKKHYLTQTMEWSTKDVSFIYCVPEDITVPESFRSRVEVDVYFCRKYVVQLGQDLARSLAKLPFLPLLPITPGVQTRPPSAVTLLKQRKLKAELASALVAPGRNSAASILSGCLEGNYGAPDKLAEAIVSTPSESSAEARIQTTLKSISIENFRAYRNKKTFEVGSAITVLYGPNGFGKTSFFDAMDFAVTGGVGRLETNNGGLIRAVKHLDSRDDEPTTVTLTLERDGLPHVITRNLEDHNNADVDGKISTRKDVLSLLTGSASAAADRVDNMVNLFRATHLFSQDRQELTRDVAEKCELPADIVSRMLAFEDYVSGLKKTEEVLRLARQSLKEATEQAQAARKTISTEQADLTRLEILASVDTSTEALDAQFAELEQVISTSGFNVSGILPRDTRSLRAMLESFAAEAIRMRTNQSKALDQISNLKILHEQLDSMHPQLEERKTQLEQVEVSANESSERLVLLTSELAQLKEQEQALLNRRDWSKWAVSAQPNYGQLIAQQQTRTADLTSLTLRLNRQKESLSKVQSEKQEADATLQRLEGNLKKAGESRLRAQELKEQASLLAQIEPQLTEKKALEAKLQGLSNEKSQHLAKMQLEILPQELLVVQIDSKLTLAKSNETTLKQLIAELRSHVEGATCLLCGHNHETQDALLDAIDQRLEQCDDIVKLNEILVGEREKLQALLTTRQIVTKELNQVEQRQTQVKIECEHLERQRMSYEMTLSSAGLTLSSDISRQLVRIIFETNKAELMAANAVSNARQLLEAKNTALSTAQDDYQTLEREQNSSTTALEAIKHQLDEILAKANRRMVNLEGSQQSLNEALRDSEVQLTKTNSSVHTKSAEIDKQKAANAAAITILTATRTSHQKIVQAVNTYQTNVQSLLANLKAEGFDSEISDEQLQQKIQVETTREVTALSLRDRVAELEVAVDKAATSAAFQGIHDRILTAQKVAEKADKLSLNIKPWVAYFEDVVKLLGDQQAIATKHFITEYGPRTAVIQQRLRPVYGFGEVEVLSKDSAISIRVRRKGKELKPTDYFSQSQVQTLVLGLFLTACSSQTWSGFSSIMMDDPVTHFDDLNTYALLDLILGLQSSPEGGRQFVISTCDEKLLQIARQKFRHMGSAAKFYRFSAIGGEGPMVNEIPA